MHTFLMLVQIFNFSHVYTIGYFAPFSPLCTLFQVLVNLSQRNVQFAAVIRTGKSGLFEQTLHCLARLFPPRTRKRFLTTGATCLAVPLVNANAANLFATFGTVARFYGQICTIRATQIGETFVIAGVKTNQLRLDIICRFVDCESIHVGSSWIV